MSNTYAKQILRSLKSEVAHPSTSSFFADKPSSEEPKRSKGSSTKTRLTTLKPRNKQYDKRKTQKKNNFLPPKTTTTIKTTKAVKYRFRLQQKNRITISEKKKVKLLCSKGSAAFGSVRNLTNASQLSPKKLKDFCDLNHHIQSMHCFIKKYCRLKVIVKDINEIWSLLGICG